MVMDSAKSRTAKDMSTPCLRRLGIAGCGKRDESSQRQSYVYDVTAVKCILRRLCPVVLLGLSRCVQGPKSEGGSREATRPHGAEDYPWLRNPLLIYGIISQMNQPFIVFSRSSEDHCGADTESKRSDRLLIFAYIANTDQTLYLCGSRTTWIRKWYRVPR
jgi:hypothetical protein